MYFGMQRFDKNIIPIMQEQIILSDVYLLLSNVRLEIHKIRIEAVRRG